MPSACKPVSIERNPKPFFGNLSQLDTWANQPEEDPRTVLPFVPRNQAEDPYAASRGKLLVCHDFKVSASRLDVIHDLNLGLDFTMVTNRYIRLVRFHPRPYSYGTYYNGAPPFPSFSHNRVTIPPPSWINAAHRHGVKILGVLIFEHLEDVPDLVRLLSGPDWAIKNDPSSPSEYYARTLADLARQRGFDGFLLNFEQSLPGGVTQAISLARWVRHLREELWKKVGPHAEVIWYDSVITTGNVQYQNRLNDSNLPFFLSSTGFFANYFWKKNQPFETAEYFYSLNPNVLLIEKDIPSPSDTSTRALTHQDVYIGIDVWGRGSLGGGGFSIHKALEEICPDSLGLSVAIFGQGWTWETRQDEVGRTWKEWWDEEVTLWTGRAPGLDLTKLLKTDASLFRPIADFFTRKPPPDPKVLPFFTTLCPGVGKGWWVQGEKVWEGPESNDQHWTSGWLDVEKCYSIGDYLWPVPTVVRDEDVQGSTLVSRVELPTARASVNLDDAWNGGSSVQLLLVESESAKMEPMPEDRSLWIPVQSVPLTPEQNYIATVAYKLGKIADSVAVDVRLEMKQPLDDKYVALEGISQDGSCSLGRGWNGLQASIKIQSKENSSIIPVELVLGLRFNICGHTSANQELCSLLLGQANVYTSQQDFEVAKEVTVNFTNYDEENVSITSGLEGLEGTLIWREIAPSAESTSPHRFAYWNVYVLPLNPSLTIEEAIDRIPEDAIWIGTSGIDGIRDGELGRFAVMGRNLMTYPALAGKLEIARKLRLFVRGVIACGKIGGESVSSYVDVRIKRSD